MWFLFSSKEWKKPYVFLFLLKAGALLKTCEGRPSQYDGDITFLGTVMSNLPIDIQLSKLIMLGHVFAILEDAIIMAAWMTIRNVFLNDFNDHLGPYSSKVGYTGGTASDCIAYLHIHQVSFKVWKFKGCLSDIT